MGAACPEPPLRLHFFISGYAVWRALWFVVIAALLTAPLSERRLQLYSLWGDSALNCDSHILFLLLGLCYFFCRGINI